MNGVDDLVAAIARWYVLHQPEVDVAAAIADGREAFTRLADAMGDLRSEGWREEKAQLAEELEERGVPRELARRHAFQPALVHVPDVMTAAQATGRSLEDVAQVFFELGEALRLEWLEHQVDELPAATRTQRWAQHALLDDVLSARRVLALQALKERPGAPPHEAVEAFLGARSAQRRRLAGVVRALSHDGGADFAGLTLAVRHLRGLAG
jgi:glutamate dehydrogenase